MGTPQPWPRHALSDWRLTSAQRGASFFTLLGFSRSLRFSVCSIPTSVACDWRQQRNQLFLTSTLMNQCSPAETRVFNIPFLMAGIDQFSIVTLVFFFCRHFLLFSHSKFQYDSPILTSILNSYTFPLISILHPFSPLPSFGHHSAWA